MNVSHSISRNEYVRSNAHHTLNYSPYSNKKTKKVLKKLDSYNDYCKCPTKRLNNRNAKVITQRMHNGSIMKTCGQCGKIQK